MNEPFWMVWCLERQTPSKRHTTEQSAIDEAVRLSEKERKSFYVMKCIGEAVPPKPPPVFWVKYAEPTLAGYKARLKEEQHDREAEELRNAHKQYEDRFGEERLVTF